MENKVTFFTICSLLLCGLLPVLQAQTSEEIVFNYPTGAEGSSPVMVRVLAPEAPQFNEETTLRLDIFNRGNVPLSDVEVNYTLPEGFVVTAVQPEVEIKEGVWSQVIETLPPQILMRYSFTGYFTKGGTVTSGLRVFCAQLIKPQSTWEHYVADAAMLDLELIGPVRARAGQVVALTACVKNLAFEPISDLNLVVRGQRAGEVSQPDVAVGNLEADSEKEIQIEFRPEVPGNQQMFFTVSNSSGAKASATYDVQVVPGQVLTDDLLTLKTTKGSRFSYGFTCKNSSRQAALNTVVQMKLPEGVEINRTEPESENTGNYIVWKLGNLASGEAVDLTFLGNGQHGWFQGAGYLCHCR